MSTMAELRRQHTGWAIQQNPTTITIQRNSKIRQDGAFAEVVTVMPAQTVRLFLGSAAQDEVVSETAGKKQTSTRYSLIADHQANIKAGPNVQDEFTVPVLGRFRVVAVYPQISKGLITGYQAELEKVK